MIKTESKRKQRTNAVRAVCLALTLLSVSACEFIGGAETLVRGSNNMVVSEGSPEAVAKMLSELLATPEITDRELLDVLSNIREKAATGDLDAAMVLLRLAAIQRQLLEEENAGDE